MRIKVLVYPKDSNPYQELLYRDMSGVKIRYMSGFTKSRTLNIILLPLELFYHRILGYSVFHLHWLYPFHFSSTNKALMRVSELYFRFFLSLIEIMNYRLVWTAHNITPHEKTFVNDQKMAIDLASRTDKVIFLNRYVSDTFLEDHPELSHQITVIPQGNYLGYYDFGKAKINKSKLVFGFVGQIKPYKGLHLLVPIIRKMRNPDIRLHIIGKCTDQTYLQELQRLAGSDKRISIENRYLESNELGKVVASFGVVVLPFISITNSSTAMLAFSAARPILTPRIGGMQDYPINTGFYYNPNELTGAVKQAVERRNEWEIMGMQALAFAKRNDWSEITKKTAKIYSDMVC